MTKASFSSLFSVSPALTSDHVLPFFCSVRPRLHVPVLRPPLGHPGLRCAVLAADADGSPMGPAVACLHLSSGGDSRRGVVRALRRMPQVTATMHVIGIFYVCVVSEAFHGCPIGDPRETRGKPAGVPWESHERPMGHH